MENRALAFERDTQKSRADSDTRTEIILEEKFMMTATVLAKQADVSLYTVRHYTRIGLLKPSRNSTNNSKLKFNDKAG